MKKITISIFLLAVVGVLIWLGYPIIKQRYFFENNQPEVKQEQNKNKTGNQLETETNQPQDQNNQADSDTNSDDQGQVTPTQESNPDCDSECSAYKNDSQKLEYCRQVCGLVPIKEKTDASECDKLTGLEKDYCFKDLAVTKKDFKICNNIIDKQIKKTCTNRIAEDIFNSSN